MMDAYVWNIKCKSICDRIFCDSQFIFLQVIHEYSPTPMDLFMTAYNDTVIFNKLHQITNLK